TAYKAKCNHLAIFREQRMTKRTRPPQRRHGVVGNRLESAFYKILGGWRHSLQKQFIRVAFRDALNDRFRRRQNRAKPRHRQEFSDCKLDDVSAMAPLPQQSYWKPPDISLVV